MVRRWGFGGGEGDVWCAMMGEVEFGAGGSALLPCLLELVCPGRWAFAHAYAVAVS